MGLADNNSNIIINHRSGKELTDTDAICRLCLEGDVPPVNSVQNISFATMKDGCKLVPPDAQLLILKHYHDDPDSGGHDGVWRTFYKLKTRFFWKNMKRSIQQYIQSCPICQKVKFKFRAIKDQMILPTYAEHLYHTVHLDFAKIHKQSLGSGKTQSFLIIIDEHTKMTHAKAMGKDTHSIIKYLNKFPHLHQIKTIITDCGTCFTSSLSKESAKINNITLKTISPYTQLATAR